MSRFFVSGYNSESSSEEEDLLSSEEELLTSSGEENEDSDFFNDDDESSSDEEDGRPSGPAYFLKKSFLKGAGGDSDSDSDDEGRKVVKSAKEKLLDDMKASIEVINVNKRTNNWIVVLSEFEKLGKLINRANQQNFGTPKFYVKLLASLDDSITETVNNEKDDKTMKADEARAFNTLRQRVKKQIKEFQVYFDLYKDVPENFDQEDESLDSFAKNQETREETRTLSPIFHNLKLINESRGKKNIDKSEQVTTLEGLISDEASDFELISLYQSLLSVRFDASSNQSFMAIQDWRSNKRDLNNLLDILVKSKVYQLSEEGQTTDDIDIEPTANEDGVKVIYGSVTSLIDRLDDEFTKSLQNTDPHSMEYVERLKDETEIYNLIVRGQAYIESIVADKQQSNQLARVVLRRLEHIYYKPNQLIKANEEEAWKNIKPSTQTPSEVIESLTQFLQSNKVFAKQALLYSIYYYAVNGDYNKAKELFLSAHFNLSDSALQVSYNRALVQLGLSAFRSGAIEESHKILNEMVNSQRSKELLGQGFNSKFPNQATVVEKQRLLPFHQHINLELLECVYMTCSLLIEIPALASNKDPKRRNASLKSFKSKLEFHDRQYFTGPPESIKDHIVHASIALQKGDWSKAYNLLSSIKIWHLFPDHDNLLAMMKNQLQIEGLRTYIFTYKAVYSKLSISKLSSIFGLLQENVSEVLTQMIEKLDINGEVSGDYIVFTTDSQRSKLQELAIVMNDKIQLLTEKNEKTSSNGYAKKNQSQTQPQAQSKEVEENKFRYANVNTNTDEF
ncbi:conserved hypothetical protein [Lodderomyces elongisporus NRRL YB-4239]|uniref:Eukaryotic translation initiation factor 3 subunit C n=1 Tax=Lodderomyces elongisporus (strain ATCC 11503 / CBS 2605 / JCM 1781 / NBRC 1676 / NRRL YB-4239) TaxID=379508 RepID=EIF3C_LODEL|nr:RecName: Full=Eukaryotic translation initiation factor 3 subunit C; Short=eIF3c; AltName: Full=Eukaryotic translation initiation factor 3 93 kDa subunit homolog; Short=eIF3 p93; AltName: Full=Translation initiation factor eIF3, p93 subunit homolog [Lodderomyces elongisporus NRRL YB-4239]EDK46060.1 conserved hypothetical protein [Lodderomyces elongisporus NRRL YB-4239]